MKDSHDDDVISTKSSEKPEIDPDAASTASSSKETVIETSEIPTRPTEDKTEDQIQSSKS